MQSEDSSAHERHRIHPGKPGLYLVLALFLALGVRLWGIGFGLPYLYHPDEPTKVVIAQTIFKTGDLNPHYFLKPGFFIYLNTLAYFPFYWIGKLVGSLQQRSDILLPVTLALGVGKTPMPSTMLLGRGLSVAFGILAMLPLYLAGRRLAGGQHVGLMALLFLAISPTNALNSLAIHPDAWVVCFAAFCLWFSLRIVERGALADYLLAGISLGLAASSKYNGAILAVVISACHLVRRGFAPARLWALLLAGTVSVLVFLATNPYALLDYQGFWAAVSQEIHHYATGHAGMEGDSLLWYISRLFRYEGPLVLIALGEGIRGLRHRSGAHSILFLFIIFYVGLISLFKVRNDRMLLLITPCLYLLAGSGLWHLGSWLRERARLAISTATVTFMVLFSICFVWPAAVSAREMSRLATHDSRWTAAEWIAQNLPPGSRIALEAYAPFVDPNRYQVSGMTQLISYPVDWYRDNDFDYLIFSQGMYGRYYQDPQRYRGSVACYESLFSSYYLLKRFDDGNYSVLIYSVQPIDTPLSSAQP